MSTIEKLSIMGIRSFGAKSEDAQSITFMSPVTLILGENGCGKTTIIECLKYALSGETPPGSDKGKNFVHDPKIFSLPDSLGQIKLLVRNIRGERLSICRSMKVAYRRDKFVFETLDSTISYLGAGGQETADSVSRRLADADIAMCEFMGVSKAIINNVLFCHQEDSSWPLDEGKKLKEKFDAIFGITEYNKTIEHLIKMRNAEKADLKVKEANLRLLVHLKKEMEDKTLILQTAEQKRDTIKNECARFDAEMKPIDDRLLEIRKIEYDVSKCQSLKVEIETKQNNCREQIVSLTKKIKTPFTGTLEELDIEIASFDENMIERTMARNETDKKLVNLKLQEKRLQSIHMDLEKKCCILAQQREKEQECTKRRAEKMSVLCKKLDIPVGVDLTNAHDSVPQLLDDIRKALDLKQSDISEATIHYEQSDQQRQRGIDKLLVDNTKLEESIIALQKQKDQNVNENRTTERTIEEIGLSAERLKKVAEKIERANEYYEELSNKLNLDNIRAENTTRKANVAKLQLQFRKLDERLTFLNSITKLTSEITLKEKEFEKKEQEVRRVKSKHSDNFKKVFTTSVEANFRRQLQVVYENLRREIKDHNQKINALKLKEQSYEIQRKNLKEEITRLEKELQESKDKVYDKCLSTPYEELLERAKSSVSKYQMEHGAQRSAEAMYKRYIQKIEEDPCCPLCHKEMAGNEAADLSTELLDEIQKLPANISRTEEQLKAEQKKYEALLQLKPVIEKVSRLEVDIPKRKQELKKIQENFEECSNNCESFQMMLVEPTANLDLANSMLGDMSLLDEAIKEVARLNQDIVKLKSKLPSGCEDNIEDLQLEKSTIAAELENERTLLEKRQQDYEKGTEALNKLLEVKNGLRDEQIQLQEGVQSLPKLKERQAELATIIETITLELEDSKSRILPLKEELKAAIAEKAKFKEEKRKEIAQMQSKFDSCQTINTEVQRLHQEVASFQELHLEMKISHLKNSIQQNKEEMAEKVNEISTTGDALDVIKAECLNQEALKRNLKDNREQKLLQQKQIDLAQEHETLSKQLGDLHFRKVLQEKNELIEKRDKATVRKGELLGQIGEINNQIKKLRIEINNPQYKDSVHNFRTADYEVEVQRRLIADLGNFRMALEWALIQFHTEKMQKINRLIREYWRLIYRGNDIDYIEIETKKTNTNKTADQKRSYDYQVIQSKNDSKIDMRGRCSAGQRVLASLIIRMALAETFSSNCGVLALDEPTTNLDRINIASLCEALNRIVEERQMQSNFMLIIITHDEEFISMLGRVKIYHRVFRNDDCKSVIRKVQVN